jgi:hypothetical protein
MEVRNEKEYRAAKSELREMEAAYEQLRGQESAKKGGSDREKLKAMMQPLNDLRGEVDRYEIQHGMRPEGAFVTVTEIK